MCRVLRVQRSGYCAWKKKPKSKRTLADESLLLKIKQSFEESQNIYGSPSVHCDLREDGVLCGEKCIARLMPFATSYFIDHLNKVSMKLATAQFLDATSLNQFIDPAL